MAGPVLSGRTETQFLDTNCNDFATPGGVAQNQVVASPASRHTPEMKATRQTSRHKIAVISESWVGLGQTKKGNPFELPFVVGATGFEPATPCSRIVDRGHTQPPGITANHKESLNYHPECLSVPGSPFPSISVPVCNEIATPRHPRPVQTRGLLAL